MSHGAAHRGLRGRRRAHEQLAAVDASGRRREDESRGSTRGVRALVDKGESLSATAG